MARAYMVQILFAQDKWYSDHTALRATVYGCTGCGKTVAFTDLICKVFADKNRHGLKAKILIVHPRLALSMNQQRRIRGDLTKYGVMFTSFHSGEVYNTLPNQKNLSTTDPNELIRIQTESPVHHITFSSYKSLYKIAAHQFDLIVCDEAHYLVMREYMDNLDLFQSKTIFYTGTPVNVTGQEASMDNRALFGEVIVEIPPSMLIPDRYVLPPRLQFLNVKTKGGVAGSVDYSETIAHAYYEQLKLVNTKYNHKMLVAMANTEHFDTIMANLVNMRKIVNDFHMDVYFVTADRVSKNGHVTYGQTARERILDDFAETPNKAIIIHCDTLAEGIDIDGIGGILLLRNLGKQKCIQTMGRGGRPANEDRLPDGEIVQDPIKTHCIVTVVRVDNEWLGNVSIEELAESIRYGGYGELTDFIDPEFPTPGKNKLPEGSDDEAIYRQIEEIKTTQIQNVLWSQLFA